MKDDLRCPKCKSPFVNELYVYGTRYYPFTNSVGWQYQCKCCGFLSQPSGTKFSAMKKFRNGASFK